MTEQSDRTGTEDIAQGVAAAPAGRERAQPPNTAHVVQGAMAGALTGWLGVLALATIGKSYAETMFVFLPAAMGLIAVVTAGRRVRMSPGRCIAVGFLSCVAATCALLIFGVEGAICIVMAVPMWAPLAFCGAVVGYFLQPGRRPGARAFPVNLSAIGMLAVLGVGEAIWNRAPTERVAQTGIEIDAPPADVWPRVIEFSDLPAPQEWYFRAGVAHPRRARIDGRGVGAVRYCEFSTGPFVEPIVVWDEPRRLAFEVTSSPPPMRELSPWDIHPPHLDGFLVSHAGQFDLIALPNGRTRLVGTTRYSNRMWPAAYWALWSDAIIHRIHAQVLEQIRREAESATSSVK